MRTLALQWRLCVKLFPSIKSAALYLPVAVCHLAVLLLSSSCRLLATAFFLLLHIAQHVRPLVWPVLADWKVGMCLASIFVYPWAWWLLYKSVIKIVCFLMRVCLFLVVGACLVFIDVMRIFVHACMYTFALAWVLSTVTALTGFTCMVIIGYACAFLLRVSLYFIVGACLTFIDVMAFLVHVFTGIIFFSMVVLGCACTYFAGTLSALGCEALRMLVALKNMMKGVRVGGNKEEGRDFKDVEPVVGVTGAGEEEAAVPVNQEEELEAAEVATDGEGAAGGAVEDGMEEKTRSRTASILSFWDGLKKRLSISG